MKKIALFMPLALALALTGCSGPKPQITHTKCDNLASRLGEYAYRAVVMVKNNGSAGSIRVTAEVTQGTSVWERSAIENFGEGEAKEVEIAFPEATLRGGEGACRYWVKSM